MSKLKKYYIKKLIRDCLFPETLCELKDRKGDFDVVIEGLNDTIKVCDLLNYQDNEITELKQQLAEKDKEIETLRFTIDEMCNANKNIHKAFEVFDKNNRHQICEKIREFIKEHKTLDDNCVFTINVDDELNTEDNLLIALAQIEKGE